MCPEHDNDPYFQLLLAAKALIAPDVEPENFTEAQRLALRVLQLVGLEFSLSTKSVGIQTQAALRKALEVLEPEVGVTRTRYECCRTVSHYGFDWNDPGIEDKTSIAEFLVNQLVSHDEAFEGLYSHLPAIEAKLATFDPRPRLKIGKKSAALILAELIYEHVDALGIKAKRTGGIKELDAIRSRISKDCDKIFKQLKPAQNKPVRRYAPKKRARAKRLNGGG